MCFKQFQVCWYDSLYLQAKKKLHLKLNLHSCVEWSVCQINYEYNDSRRKFLHVLPYFFFILSDQPLSSTLNLVHRFNRFWFFSLSSRPLFLFICRELCFFLDCFLLYLILSRCQTRTYILSLDILYDWTNCFWNEPNEERERKNCAVASLPIWTVSFMMAFQMVFCGYFVFQVNQLWNRLFPTKTTVTFIDNGNKKTHPWWLDQWNARILAEGRNE